MSECQSTALRANDIGHLQPRPDEFSLRGRGDRRNYFFMLCRNLSQAAECRSPLTADSSVQWALPDYRKALTRKQRGPGS
jgi:hypothetical protein